MLLISVTKMFHKPTYPQNRTSRQLVGKSYQQVQNRHQGTKKARRQSQLPGLYLVKVDLLLV